MSLMTNVFMLHPLGYIEGIHKHLGGVHTTRQLAVFLSNY